MEKDTLEDKISSVSKKCLKKIFDTLEKDDIEYGEGIYFISMVGIEIILSAIETAHTVKEVINERLNQDELLERIISEIKKELKERGR